MDKTTTINELKEKVIKFRDIRDWKQFHNPKDSAIALNLEASEVLEHFRFKDKEEIEEYLKNPEKLKELSHELADVLYFILIMANDLNIDLSEALKEKLIISDKKYPVKLSKGKNVKYTEYQRRLK